MKNKELSTAEKLLWLFKNCDAVNKNYDEGELQIFLPEKKGKGELYKEFSFWSNSDLEEAINTAYDWAVRRVNE